MILKTLHTKKNFSKLNLITISFVIAYFGALLYPHHALGGGVLLDGKTIIELLLFSSFALFTTSRLSSPLPLLENSPLTKPLAALTALIAMASLFSWNRPLALEAIFLYLAYLCCFIIFLALFRENNQQVILVYIVLSLTLLLCCFGLRQYHFFNLNPRLTAIWRLRATFGNSNQMAGFLAMTIPLYVGFLLSKKFSAATFSFLYLILFIMLTALLFTYARGGWIATSVGITFILIVQAITGKIQLKKIIIPSLAGLAVIFLFLLSNTDLVKRFNTITQDDTAITLRGRKLAWQGTIDMIRAHPVHGVGPGNYSKAFRSFQPPGLAEPYINAHNDYLQFISETGVLLIPVLCWLLYNLFSHGLYKIGQVDQQVRGITMGAMGGITALLLYSVSDFNLHIPANALLFTILAAIVASPVSKRKNIGIWQRKALQ